jgi:hypothetical protein
MLLLLTVDLFASMLSLNCVAVFKLLSHWPFSILLDNKGFSCISRSLMLCVCGAVIFKLN